MIRVCLLATLMIASLIFTGCKGPQYPNCKTDDQCKIGSGADAKNGVCVFGKCQECAADADCPASGRCENNMCLKSCMADSDCGVASYCQAGFCHANCLDSSNCSAGQICNAGRCLVQTSCTDKSDCGEGFACESGFCTQTTRMNDADKCLKEARVFFDFDMFDIKSDSATELDQIAVCLRGDTSVKLLVTGHTDDRGSTEYNLSLGERRANVVADYLSRSGIARSHINTVSYGEEKPLEPSENEAAWTKNRRSEISTQ